jgi:hypothetical protein
LVQGLLNKKEQISMLKQTCDLRGINYFANTPAYWIESISYVQLTKEKHFFSLNPPPPKKKKEKKKKAHTPQPTHTHTENSTD